MALPGSGAISFSQINAEFGPTNPSNDLPNRSKLGSYRITETIGNSDHSGTLGNIPLDGGIPTSGAISFGHFRGKKLNIIVDFYGDQEISYKQDAKASYNANAVHVVGGLTSKPNNTSGKKIIVHVNKTIGSGKDSRNQCALKTGRWDDGTELIVSIGSSGKLYGAGGDGGAGRLPVSIYVPGELICETQYDGDGNVVYTEDGNVYEVCHNTSFSYWASNSSPGGQGSSALGIQYPTTLINNGNIIGGTGGGGGGAGSYAGKHSDVKGGCKGYQPIADGGAVSGGGGGGGRGLPGGSSGGIDSGYVGDNGTQAQKGGSGSTTKSGGGGAGGSAPNESQKCWTVGNGGAGGAGGQGGGNGSGSLNLGGKPPGSSGCAIIIGSGGSLTKSVPGTITGSEEATEPA